MKKSLFLIVAAVMMLAANSCKKENVNEPNEPEVNREPQANEFCADIANGGTIQGAPSVNGDDMTTKATFDGLIVKWQSNDVIKVNGNDNTTWTAFNCEVTTDTEKGTTRAYFSNGSSYSKSVYHAFYSTSIDVTGCQGANAKLNATQVWNPDNTAENIPMYATSSDHWLTFNNICAVLKINNIFEDATKIVITADEKLNGDITVNNNVAELSDTDNTGTNTITVQKSDNSALGTGDIYAAIPAGTYHHLEIVIYDATNTVLFTTGKSQKEFKPAANKIYKVSTYEVKLNQSICFTGTSTDSVTISMTWFKSSATQASADLMDCHLDYTLVKSDGTTIIGTPIGGTAGNGSFVQVENCKVPGSIVKMPTTNCKPVTIGKDDKLYIYATRGKSPNNFESGLGNSGKGYWFNALGTGTVDLSGNILYIISSDLTRAEYEYQNTSYVLCGIFRANVSSLGMNCLTTADKLILPDLSPAMYGLSLMFYNNPSLVKAPTIRAKTLSQNYCCQDMFSGCRGLTEVTIETTSITGTNCLYNWLATHTATSPTGTIYIDSSIYTSSTSAKIQIPRLGWYYAPIGGSAN